MPYIKPRLTKRTLSVLFTTTLRRRRPPPSSRRPSATTPPARAPLSTCARRSPGQLNPYTRNIASVA